VGSALDVLGVRVDPTNMEAAVNTIVGWARAADRSCRYVCVSGVHGVIEAQSDEVLRSILNTAHLNVPDGMPLSWIGWFTGFKSMNRVYGPDLMLKVCEASMAHGLSHFFYGGKEGIAENLAETMQRDFPGLKVAGTYCPPFRLLRDDEKSALRERINSSGAHIVWVGLSTPKQEKWMGEFCAGLDARVLLGVGAAFDYNVGRIRRAPHLIQILGLEWVFRVLQEPKRLMRRYLTVIPRFVSLGFLQASGVRTAEKRWGDGSDPSGRNSQQ
jgi:N-acetylglucosaminyldiphosphoundecaprenol N-acetyl-beta-D-mannosaminyltransferase